MAFLFSARPAMMRCGSMKPKKKRHRVCPQPPPPPCSGVCHVLPRPTMQSRWIVCLDVVPHWLVPDTPRFWQVILSKSLQLPMHFSVLQWLSEYALGCDRGHFSVLLKMLHK